LDRKEILNLVAMLGFLIKADDEALFREKALWDRFKNALVV